MKSYTIQELREGLTVQEEFPVTEQMGIEFSGVSGYTNPVHLDQDYAKATRFGAKIAHGMLIGSFISNVIGTRMPGEGSIYMKQEMTFLRPVYYGDRITVEIAVKALQKDRNRAVLSTDCYNQKGEKVLAGEALVMPKEEK